MSSELDKSQEFLWQVHGYQNEYIRFADGKAAVCVAWSTGLLGALYSADIQRIPDSSTGYLVLAVCGAGGLIGSFILGVFAVMPRQGIRSFFGCAFSRKVVNSGETTKVGLIFWKDVRKHFDANTYVSAIENADSKRLINELGSHIFELSKIADRKYTCINLSILSAFVGSVCTALVLMLNN